MSANPETQRALAEYKAQIDAKYANAGIVTSEKLSAQKAVDAERRRKDRWLLINPSGQIVGVLARHVCETAMEAFEDFYPRKRERLEAARQGWRIEEDDADGTRFEEFCAEIEAPRK